jgi:hypothetical protein
VAEPLAFGSEAGTVVFVSVSPGSVAGAASAHGAIGDAPGCTVGAVDGGFDPVAVPGAAGDTVSVTITDSAGKSTTTRGTAKSVPGREWCGPVRRRNARMCRSTPLNYSNG